MPCDNHANLVLDTAYDYDLIGRLTQIDHTDGTSTIHKFDFTYDDASRIATLTSSVDGLRTYSYDDTNQLTEVEDATTSTLESYAYDDNGNRTGGGYSTGDYNRLTSDGTYNYEYDNEGNRVRRVHISSGAATVYQWDHRNRLMAVIEYADETDADNDDDRQHSVEHQYDAFNQWIAKTVDADGGGMGAAVAEFYIHDDGQIVFRLDDSGDVVNRYVWDPTAVDQLWADEAVGDELRWSLTDHLGSVHDLVDNAGNIDKHVEYDSFGNVTADSATAIDLLFWFTGRPLDDDTGLQNNLHRWYDAAMGRWVSEDPIGFDGKDFNIYRYVRNGVLRFTDPLGLLTKEQWRDTVLKKVGITRAQLSQYNAFNEANRAIMTRIYGYYTSVFEANPDLLWAGMAKLAGRTVWNACEEADAGSALAPGHASSIAQRLEAELLRMNLQIFLDLAWQHEAFLSGGYEEMKALHAAGEINDDELEAWYNIAGGTTEGIQSAVNYGNELLLRREQQFILARGYRELSRLNVGPAMSYFATSPVPGGSDFLDIVPNGDLCNFNDRWSWIKQDMLPKYQQMTPEERMREVQRPLVPRLEFSRPAK